MHEARKDDDSFPEQPKKYCFLMADLSTRI